MSIPLFFPAVTYVRRLSLARPITLRQLCRCAGVVCRASGPWTERKIEIVRGKTLGFVAEPGDWGALRIQTPTTGVRQRSRLALAVLAYGMHDLVAKQSLLSHPWRRLRPPRGRPRRKRPLSACERQRRFRKKMRSDQPAVGPVREADSLRNRALYMHVQDAELQSFEQQSPL